jgi:L-alanine-DL-glutamate epimerase-like enolase superfamily enzyme
MKIVRIRAYRPQKPNPTFNQSDMVVTVETDEGITGVGDGGSPDTIKQCAGVIMGEDPRRIHHLWQLLYRGYFYPAGREKLHAMGALDTALWDILGKTLGVPIYQMLGGRMRDHIDCYCTGFPWQGSWAETARACIQAGFRAFRTGVAGSPDQPFDSRAMVRKSYEECAEIAEAVRSVGGEWAIDFHTRLDLPDAIRLANLLDPLDPLFVEDPIRSENPEALAAVRAQVKTPLAVGEQFGDRWDVNTLLERHLIDYTRITLPNVGGITEWQKIAALCETHYVGMIPHFTGPIAVAALSHVLTAFTGPALTEMLSPGSRSFPHLSVGFDFRDGKLRPAESPGLGVEFDPAGAEQVLEVTERYAPIPTLRRPDGSFTNW